MAFTLKKVLITDKIDPKCVTILKTNGIDVDINTDLAKDKTALLAEIPKYDGLIVRSATKVTADVIAAASNLKIIGRAGTGVDNIDCKAATKHGVIVMNTPGGNTLSAAEHTCTLLLACSRHVSNGTESLRAGRWDRSKFMGNEVYGKTLGIVGLGKIGKEVAIRMQSFGMKTIGFDPIVSAEEAAEFDTEWLPLEKIWPLADYITVHTPLIPQTKNLINSEVFSQCKKGVRVINCARGGIIDEVGLLEALNDGRCGGAGLDVFVEEPPTNLDLVQHKLVVSTPHLGASTVEAQSRVAEEIAQQFVDMTNGKTLVGALNAQALANAMSPCTMPFVRLGTALGKCAAALQGELKEETQVKIITHGGGLKDAGSYLTSAALVGLLKEHSQNGLNLVSAPAYAKETGIKTKSEHKSDVPKGLDHLVTLEIQQGSGTPRILCGIVAAGYPVLVSIDDAKFPQGAPLAGNAVIYKGKNAPQTFSSVIGTLSGTDTVVQSYSSSSAVGDESWSVLQVSAQLANLDSMKAVTSHVYQFSF